MKLHALLPFVVFISFFISCKKSDGGNTGGGGTSPLSAQTFLDVTYGTDAAQKMDVYLPANRSTASTKVIILIHGGAWSGGDKKDFSTSQFGMVITDTLKTRFPDYAIFNINYRLSTGTTNLFPAQENDVKAALQFIYDHAADYFISNKYVFIGESAGAHLGMLQGYKYSTPLKPKVIVSLFGPSDLTDMYNNPVGPNPTLAQLVLAQTIGATPANNAALYTSSSPVNFIGAGSPPTILLHGSNDPLVNPSQSVAVQTKLTTAGVASQYVLYPGKGHGDDWGDAIYKDAFNKIQAFIIANMP
ncbi:alpha/beta hydrolase fold domain-containing protein [Ferruginibacter sp. SUN106]|uniref:alpha/beta hydrolase fold domain-containing protein n=1 Tax=Ferruginibacter sp. SUN106 TaxID=2978348 RepID=UPI003D367403